MGYVQQCGLGYPTISPVAIERSRICFESYLDAEVAADTLQGMLHHTIHPLSRYIDHANPVSSKLLAAHL